MNKIKIAYVVKNFINNGISNVVYNIIDNLSSEYDIVLFYGEPIYEEYFEKIKNKNIKLEALPDKEKFPIKYYCSLLKGLKKYNFDIIHINGNSSTMIVDLLISLIAKIRVRIAHCHSCNTDHLAFHKIFKPLVNLLCTGKFACSELSAKWMYYNNFHVIPNFFETKRFIFNECERNKIRGNLKFKESDIVIGHVGRFNRFKNQKYLLKIFEELGENNNYKLLMVGDGPDFKEIEALVNEHKYKDRIILYGDSKNVNLLYNCMDIFVFPSIFEGLGIALLEAQINGLPCICSNIIPQEAIITNLVLSCSLQDNIKEWVRLIEETKINDNRNNTINLFEESINMYDTSFCISVIDKLYRDYLNKR